MQKVWPEVAHDVIPSFKSYRLGPVLAYSLNELNSKSGGREKLFELLKAIPQGSRVLTNFGEIDCRVHLVKQAREQGRYIEDVVSECVDRYVSVLKEIKSDFRVFAWAVVPSTLSESSVDPRYPHVGTNLERNHATSLFNGFLKTRCEQEGIGFISIFDQLVDGKGRTRGKYFGDQVHLSQKAMPLAVEEIARKIPDLSMHLFPGFLGTLPFTLQRIALKIKSEVMTFVYFSYKNARSFARTLIRGN